MGQKNKNPTKVINAGKNPFETPNPYRVKAKFNSQHKSRHYNKQQTRSTNPQSLLYKRNFRENAAVYTSQSNDIYKQKISERDVRISVIEEQLQKKTYQLEYKKFLADSYCPSDPYLEIVKDKLAYLGGNSQFQMVMRMGSLGNKYNNMGQNVIDSRMGLHGPGQRQNPFYRKNLCSKAYQADSDKFPVYGAQYSTILESRISKIEGNFNYRSRQRSQYQSSAVNEHRYEQFSEAQLNKKYSASNYQSTPNDPYLYKNGTRTYDNVIQNQSNDTFQPLHKKKTSGGSHHRTKSPSQSSANSPRELECSFGHRNGHKHMKLIKDYIDSIIQKPIPSEIQTTAPKELKIKGKTFVLNHVHKPPQ